ncbi:MAG: hypothetical protein GC154_01885 [bacterium]|nr:hypothetical protein [bacterium]
MNQLKSQSFCVNCRMNRRNFIKTGCIASAAVSGLATGAGSLYAGENDEPTKIHVIYSLHDVVQPGPDWPNVGYDFGPVMAKFNSELKARCAGFQFIDSMAKGPEDASAILKADETGDVDGYLVFQMNCWNRVVQTIAESGKPVLYADYPFAGSGGFLTYSAGFIRQNKKNAGFVSSSKIEDLTEAVQCFAKAKKAGPSFDFAAAVQQTRVAGTPKAGGLSCLEDHLKTASIDECVKRLKESKILAVRDQNSGPAEPIFGIPMENVSFAEVNQAWERADKDESREIAARWRKNATEVIDVSDETLVTSAAMYLGMKDVLKKHGANAITINCLGGFYGGHIHAYPCLGFHELNNEALVGACECDLRSTASMLTANMLTKGRPGYISDPVIDTSKRQIIYAHCVASNKAFGPEGKTNPFTIMTHSEDRQGASVRSILPLGYLTTSIQINQPTKEILFHQGKAAANDPDDRACRTKLAVEPLGDIEKLFTEWDQWGWHRVTVYGDLKEPIFALADRMGYTIVEEA